MTRIVIFEDEFTVGEYEAHGTPKDIADRLIEYLEDHRHAGYKFVNDLLEKIDFCFDLPGFLYFEGIPTHKIETDLYDIQFCAVFENADHAIMARLSL